MYYPWFALLQTVKNLILYPFCFFLLFKPPFVGLLPSFAQWVLWPTVLPLATSLPAGPRRPPSRQSTARPRTWRRPPTRPSGPAPWRAVATPSGETECAQWPTAAVQRRRPQCQPAADRQRCQTSRRVDAWQCPGWSALDKQHSRQTRDRHQEPTTTKRLNHLQDKGKKTRKKNITRKTYNHLKQKQLK